ncbi:MAG: hypothetical protein JWP80_4210 [Pseudomonas sp.]|nr:hypothetical protein [Pseudomonas sp.]
MSISSVGSSAADYSTPAAPATGSNDAASAAPDPAASQPPAAPAPSPSTTVTLSDGTVSNVVLYSGKMTSMPMSVAAAPQLFFAADKDHDGKLSLDEFTNQMKRVGMTSDEAKQLYQQFNKSKGKELSIDDYVDGVVATNTSGSSAFQDVYLSYTSGKDGKYDMAVDNAFMAQGASTAAAYWAKHPELQRRS